MAASSSLSRLNSLLVEYFYSWRPYKVILKRLEVVHGIKRSLRWLKLKFTQFGLKRRDSDPPVNLLRMLIKRVLRTPNGLRGYRGVWKVLRDKDTVMGLLQQLDPNGVACRKKRCLKRRVYRSKGPNFLWHCDGYDKLSGFGLCIHGCIDGFSRKILWLRVASTNHNSKVIGRYFLECVEKHGGCPAILRTDCGTENSLLATLQIGFRLQHTDSLAGEKSFFYGASKSNIRIEAWWSQLRRRNMDWWIDLCKNLETNGDFDSRSTVHRKCLTFTLAPLIQVDLDDFMNHWNSHPIRKCRTSESPAGIPNDLYDIPESYGGENYMKNVIPSLWATAMWNTQLPRPFFDATFDQVAVRALYCIDMSPQDITHENCRAVYLYLVQVV